MEDKAKELVDKFYNEIGIKIAAKQCALICVDEMQKVEENMLKGLPLDSIYLSEPNLEGVKQDIEKL